MPKSPRDVADKLASYFHQRSIQLATGNAEEARGVYVELAETFRARADHPYPAHKMDIQGVANYCHGRADEAHKQGDLPTAMAWDYAYGYITGYADL